MYSTCNEGKSVDAERFIRTLKNKIFQHMTAFSNNVYSDAIDDVVNKYNTVQRTIKMKPIDIISDCFGEYNEKSNEKDPKFKAGDHVRISKYKNIFAKRYTPNWSEKVFVIKEVENTVPWTYVINDLNVEEITALFYEKELQKINKQGFRIEKSLKEKEIKYMSKGNDMIIHLIAGLIKTT